MLPIDVLRQYWGHNQFRPQQAEIIQSVLEGRDTLALLPTGGGKSVCFQVPALCQEGICIVVSPLIALMKDQVQNLQKKGIPALAIYAGMSYRDIDRLLDNCVYGEIKFLYLSPERLVSDLAIARIRQMKVNLIAVDEAHCISQWGYDFRPPYLEIAKIREFFPKVPVLALTATATPEVVSDIQEKLAFKEAQVFQSSFSRSNLAYIVRSTEAKENQLIDILQKVPGSGVVYVRNRRRTKEIAQLLQKKRISADFYHAGLTSDERSGKQDAWVAGRTRIMVSTNAFGMGIDKPDVRTVVHLELPDSLEAYFQEAGRAGRDGQKSFAVLLYNPGDKRSLEYQYEQAFPSLDEARKVYRALGSFFQLALGGGQGESYDFDIATFCQNYQLEVVRVFNCLKLLEQEGLISLSEAVYTPSTLLIKVDKERLYDYQLKNPALDKLLKIILRSYQGVFSNYVNFSEKKLTEYTKTSAELLQKQLLLMQQDQILEYNPQKDKPQLSFLRAREDANHLSFDTKLYNFRKTRHAERIKKAIAYAEDNICRSQQLLHYFGEKDAPACGVCDVCLERKKQALDNESFERLRQKITRLLSDEALPVKELVDSFTPKMHQDVLETLTFMQQEGLIEERNGKLFVRE
ncbi:ATP-dependent DNA helicase RecQ [Haliscomenobacter sp.]|uniref:RecQ family ATP-dependent DNA helicase n=1 Tax=Haliscomenobacter sp. TaxID=2717303 RepID=UPI003364F83A